MIIQAAVTHSNLKNLHKYCYKPFTILATPTSTTTDAMVLKIFKPGALATGWRTPAFLKFIL